MATKQAKYGKAYDSPIGLQEDNYYEMMYELMEYVNRKGLTTRQAQHLFSDCFDMVLDVKPTNEPIGTDYLKSISDSLNKIASSGIDTFRRCSTTNY
ncbi:MAG: hypothetical protein K2J20_01045 [Bacilli bacterium]|nr:hypothetical protein [Bacilli bacterium]